MILLVGELKQRAKDLTPWERQFIFNIDKLLLQQRELSFKQKLCVEKIAKRFKPASEQKHPAKKKSRPPRSCNGIGPTPCMIRQLKNTIFYSGETPPWEL